MARILIVDDNDSIRDSLADAMRDEGYEVEAVADGAKGLAAALARPPDVILLDLMMPVMDGHAFMARLREDGSHQRIPVVITSASPQVPEGARAHLRKPYELHRLLDVISQHQDGHRAA